jgi:hypothetical protein
MGRGLLGLVAVLALATTAHAGPRADYRQEFTTATPGASTGVDTRLVYKNPADPNAKPFPVREEQFTLPEGTTFDNAVVPPCQASDLEVMLLEESACPPESRIGGGEGTTMSGFPGAGETPITIVGWEYGTGTLLLAGAKQYHLRQTTRLRRDGRVITAQVPHSPGGPPDGESALRRAHSLFTARSLGTRAYVRTPPTCPDAGVWTFAARFTFADGAVEHDSYDMPCARPRAPRVTRHHRARRRHHRSPPRHHHR